MHLFLTANHYGGSVNEREPRVFVIDEDQSVVMSTTNLLESGGSVRVCLALRDHSKKVRQSFKLNFSVACFNLMSGIIVRVCILDDDPSVLRSVQVLLASDGLEAQVFNSPNKFLSYARNHVVKVAVLDVWMPEANGIEVQKRLYELSPGTRVIMITGREATSTRADALKGGAFAFLTKPFDDEAFLNAVHGALENDS